MPRGKFRVGLLQLPPVALVSGRHTDPELCLLYRGSSDCRDIAASSGVGAVFGAVHDIAVIIDLYPLATAADMRIYVRAHINHVCVFLGWCCLPRQTEVELSWLARLRLGVGNRCFDLSIDNESGFVSGNSQAIANVATVGTSFNNLGKVLRFNTDIGAFDWPAARIFHKPFKNRRASANAEGYQQRTNETKNKRFREHSSAFLALFC